MQLKDAFKKSGIGLDIISKIEDEEHKVKLQQLEEEKQRQKQEIEDCKERNRKRKEYDEFVKLVKVKSDNFMFHIIYISIFTHSGLLFNLFQFNFYCSKNQNIIKDFLYFLTLSFKIISQ